MKFRRVIPIIYLLTIFLTLTTAGASAADSSTVIQEIYSDIESCDITIASSRTVEDLTLEVQLLQEGRAIDKATIPIDRIEANSISLNSPNGTPLTSRTEHIRYMHRYSMERKNYAPQNMSSFTADRSSPMLFLKA